jgi:hypothetical protein
MSLNTRSPRVTVVTKFSNLLYRQLPDMGISWEGTSAEFREIFSALVDSMPNDIGDVAERYYILNNSQQIQKDTGIPVKTDALFYQKVRIARQIIAAILTLIQKEPDIVRRLLEAYHGENNES